ncbi:cysteine peptidase family C39 domain-containing protein [Providencia manganoxydans]
MDNEQTQSTLYFIGIIIKLSGDIDHNEFNKVIDKEKPLHESLADIKKLLNVKCRFRKQSDRSIEKIESPSIIYDNDNIAYLLANFNHEQVLIQRFGNHAPEIWTIDEFKQKWSGKWLQVKSTQSKFDITWFQTEFLKYKDIIA